VNQGWHVTSAPVSATAPICVTVGVTASFCRRIYCSRRHAWLTAARRSLSVLAYTNIHQLNSVYMHTSNRGLTKPLLGEVASRITKWYRHIIFRQRPFKMHVRLLQYRVQRISQTFSKDQCKYSYCQSDKM